MPPMKLDQYLSDTKTTSASFAEKLGCAVSTVTRWRNGETRPDAALALKVFEATAGQVTPNDFFDVQASADGEAA